MNRPTFADPKTDFVFKRIFGSEQHKDVLVAPWASSSPISGGASSRA